MRLNDYVAAPTRINKRRRASRIRLYTLLATGVLLIGASIWYVTTSNFFTIKDFTLIGLEGKDKIQFKKKVESQIIKDSFVRRTLGAANYLAWPKKIENTFPEIASITVHKDFLKRAIEIDITPREPFGIWCMGISGQKCYWFDTASGTIIKEASFSEGQLVFRISEASAREVTLGKPLIATETFQKIKTILENTRALNISIKEAVIKRDIEELHIKATNGAKLFFSLRFDPSAALFESLGKILDRTPISHIDYIDLTVPRKVYVKEW